jgi:uncharacterized membrane protein
MLSYLQYQTRTVAALEPREYFRSRVRAREARYHEQVRKGRSKSLGRYLLSVVYNSYNFLWDIKGYELRKYYQDLPRSEFEAKTIAVEHIQSVMRMYMLRRRGSDAAIVRSVESRFERAEWASFGGLVFAMFPVFLTCVMALTLSWNSMRKSDFSHVTGNMQAAQVCGNAAAVGLYVITILHRPASEYSTLVDVVLLGVATMALFSWRGGVNDDDDADDDENTQFGLVVYAVFAAYAVLRTWSAAVDEGSANEEEGASSRDLDKLTLVWSTRSAALVERLAPSIEAQVAHLADSWQQWQASEDGDDAASIRDVLDIRIHCTDTDQAARARLLQSLENTTLASLSALQLGRPSYTGILKQHERRMCLLDLINGDSVRTNTLVGYCGHPHVGRLVLRAVEGSRVTNATTLPDQSHNHIYFEQENYGQVAQQKKKDPEPNAGDAGSTDIELSQVFAQEEDVSRSRVVLRSLPTHGVDIETPLGSTM